MFALRLHPEADAEAINDAAWIQADDPREGVLFVEALTKALNRARQNPENYRKFDGEYRKVKVGKFRYSVIYRFHSEEVQVIAVMHHRKKPGYWRSRARLDSADWPTQPG